MNSTHVLQRKMPPLYISSCRRAPIVHSDASAVRREKRVHAKASFYVFCFLCSALVIKIYTVRSQESLFNGVYKQNARVMDNPCRCTQKRFPSSINKGVQRQEPVERNATLRFLARKVCGFHSTVTTYLCNPTFGVTTLLQRPVICATHRRRPLLSTKKKKKTYEYSDTVTGCSIHRHVYMRTYVNQKSTPHTISPTNHSRRPTIEIYSCDDFRKRLLAAYSYKHTKRLYP